MGLVCFASGCDARACSTGGAPDAAQTEATTPPTVQAVGDAAPSDSGAGVERDAGAVDARPLEAARNEDLIALVEVSPRARRKGADLDPDDFLRRTLGLG